MSPTELRRRLVLALSSHHSARDLAEVFRLSERHVRRILAEAEAEADREIEGRKAS